MLAALAPLTPCNGHGDSTCEPSYGLLIHPALVTYADAASTPGAERIASTVSAGNPPVVELSTTSARRLSE